jgi:hypothetical protein
MKSPGDNGLGILGEGLHPAAARVAEHDDMLHLERSNAELERRGNAVRLSIGLVGRHDVGDVAHDEELARARVENDLRRHAGIAAADHHHFWRLPGFPELAIAVLLAAQAAVEESAIALDETLWKRHAGP